MLSTQGFDSSDQVGIGDWVPKIDPKPAARRLNVDQDQRCL